MLPTRLITDAWLAAPLSTTVFNSGNDQQLYYKPFVVMPL